MPGTLGKGWCWWSSTYSNASQLLFLQRSARISPQEAQTSTKALICGYLPKSALSSYSLTTTSRGWAYFRSCRFRCPYQGLSAYWCDGHISQVFWLMVLDPTTPREALLFVHGCWIFYLRGAKWGASYATKMLTSFIIQILMKLPYFYFHIGMNFLMYLSFYSTISYF